MSRALGWPTVLSEDETLDRVIAGHSLARFGDGEIHLMLGGNAKLQDYRAVLSGSLRKILTDPSPNCVVGIPRLDGPKASFWKQFDRPQVHELFGSHVYGSAFVTRPDSAPNINRAGYWYKLRKLWVGKFVTLVRGSDKSLTPDMLTGATHVSDVIVPAKNAFDHYERIMREISYARTVILCAGPAATVIAHDLSARGVHAIDLGHIGLFLRKYKLGQPMKLTAADKQ